MIQQRIRMAARNGVCGALYPALLTGLSVRVSAAPLLGSLMHHASCILASGVGHGKRKKGLYECFPRIGVLSIKFRTGRLTADGIVLLGLPAFFLGLSFLAFLA